MQLIKEGAEARLYKTELGERTVLVKERVPKEYRVKELDEAIRKQRTKREEKLLRTAERIGIRVPAIFGVKEHKIIMEFIHGKTLREALDEKNIGLCTEVGKIVGKMHSQNLIHGDITTSNIILDGKGLVFLDFGLGFTSSKQEDKAVDLLNLRKTLQATHSLFFEKCWKKIVNGYLQVYPKKDVIAQIERVERRARYKGAQ